MRVTSIAHWFASLVVAAILGLGPWPVAANVVLQIDVSDPSAVSIAATGENAVVDDSSTGTLDGVTLVGLFTSGVDVGANALAGNLTPAGTTVAYDNQLSATFSRVNLNLYNPAGSQTQTFSTTTAAFSGTGISDLASVSASLPSPGAIGDVRVGGSVIVPLGAVIGQYEVVPLPVPALMLLSGLIGLAAVRRFRR